MASKIIAVPMMARNMLNPRVATVSKRSWP